MNNNILNNKAFDCLNAEVKQAFVSFSEGIKNKPSDERLPMIIAFVQSLPKGITLTNDEKRAMIDAVTENMNEREKKQINMLFKMLGM